MIFSNVNNTFEFSMIDADTPQHCLQCWCMIIFAQTARCFVSVGYTVTQTQTNTNSRSIFSATWVQTFQPAKVTECFQQSQTTLFLITQLRPRWPWLSVSIQSEPTSRTHVYVFWDGFWDGCKICLYLKKPFTQTKSEFFRFNKTRQ